MKKLLVVSTWTLSLRESASAIAGVKQSIIHSVFLSFCLILFVVCQCVYSSLAPEEVSV